MWMMLGCGLWVWLFIRDDVERVLVGVSWGVVGVCCGF